MERQDSLTNLQKVALRGEVAYAVSTATHDAEIKYRVYRILKEREEEYKPFLVSAFKESVLFDETIIDKIYFETLMDRVPVWIWVEKIIADIKEAVNLTEVTSVSRASIDKIAERKKIIESSFVMFARKVLLVSPDASEQLFDEILKDNDLDFLHTTCFYFKSSCEEARDVGTVQDKVPQELMEYLFDIGDILSLRVETEALNILNEGKTERKKKIKEKAIKRTEDTDMTYGMLEAELTELINRKIISLFCQNQGQAPKYKFKYVVNRVFTDTQISTTIRVCDTREEAEKFIEKIKKEYPELQNTCEFFISKEKENGKK